MKIYIDAKQLSEKIESIGLYVQKSADYNDGCNDMKMMVLDLIDSLRQEQPMPSCKSCGFYENNCPFIRGTFKPYPNKVCKDYTYSVMKEQEQPEVDLEKEIKNERSILLDLFGPMNGEQSLAISNLARHFYELGLKTRN